MMVLEDGKDRGYWLHANEISQVKEVRDRWEMEKLVVKERVCVH